MSVLFLLLAGLQNQLLMTSRMKLELLDSFLIFSLIG